MIARGMAFPELADKLKELYVEACNRHFRLEDKRLTDSRISLLTGLQRKDIRVVRTRLENSIGDAEPQAAGPLPRILARWMGGAPYADEDGAPISLARGGAEEASFEALAAEVSRDIHARTVLDELIRLGMVHLDDGDDRVSLIASAYLPSRDDAALLGYFGANLGDHAEAVATNLLSAPKPGPFFDRSVHYNKLTPEALGELDAMARQLQSDALLALNSKALELQERDAGSDAATGRFRCGAYIYRSIGDDPKGKD
jgi:hypothetical protein